MNPYEEAVRKAVTKEEMARLCRRRTRGVEETSKLLDSLFSSMSTATDALGVPLFRDHMLTTVWPEQKKHLPCIQDPPGVQLYTVTGYDKGGVRRPVGNCCGEKQVSSLFTAWQELNVHLDAWHFMRCFAAGYLHGLIVAMYFLVEW